ncbi:RNA polymerase, sigma subunit, ECF family [Myxococcus fulvus]|uniref:Extracytoplasmic sigma factor ECF n=2 Tax=Myxococcus fulvus TaxID=33 RepID=A0A511T3C1_MYXFU|nr:extracytoplasmic sigma factor ECF [Myxococcus fulvus]SEU20668.1 RNA polymerase, sigma subunit, ECF family [Myxococcus fulvus]
MGMSEKTSLLEGARNEGAEVRDALQGVAYQELREMTHAAMSGEASRATLRPMLLLRDICGRWAGESADMERRRHVLGVGAQAMRRALVEAVRVRNARRRDALREPLYLHDEVTESPVGVDIDVLGLERVLVELESFKPRLARLVELRYFAGLGIQETAAVLGVAPATVRRDWTFARGWLCEGVGH